MVRSRKVSPKFDEFPLLTQNNLKPVDTLGDGNCLFNALSDQLYGTSDKQHEIRTNVIAYMRTHADDFRPFTVVEPTRRNPKRKNVGVTVVDTQLPSEEQLERAFQARLTQMAKGGTWGDNQEVVAFAKAYQVDIIVWRSTWKAEVPGALEDVARPELHIAYHEYGHYSSVRNINGPFIGLPAIKYVDPKKAARFKMFEVSEWMIKAVISSIPYTVDEQTVRKTLQMCNCSVPDAVSKLIQDQPSCPPTPASILSSSGGSSIERDHDDDDYVKVFGPSKRQIREFSPTPELPQNEAQSVETLETKPATLPKVSSSACQSAQQNSTPMTKPRGTDKSSTANLPHQDGEATTKANNKNKSSSTAPVPVPCEESELTVRNKTTPRRNGPQAKRISAARQKDIKKAAQKQASNQRKRQPNLLGLKGPGFD